MRAIGRRGRPCHTGLVPVDRTSEIRWSACVRAARWLLVGLVIAGVFVLHVLSSHDMSDGHGPLSLGPLAGSATAAEQPTPTSAAEVSSIRTGGSERGGLLPGQPEHLDLAACELFLVAGAALTMLTLTALWSTRHLKRLTPGALAPTAPRAPLRTSGSSTFSLCVLRV